MTMRKLLLGAAAALSVAAPNVASAADGYLDLSYSNTDAGAGVDTINFGGAVNFDLTSSLEAQADIHYARPDVDGYNRTYSAANLHVFHREEGYLLGGFAGYEEASYNLDAYHFGVEGQLYLSRVTLDGAVAYTSAEAGTYEESGSTARAGATWFITDDLSAGVSYRTQEIGPFTTDTAALTAEWKPGAAPYSFYAAYRDSEIETPTAYDFDTWEIGFRWNLGTGSLIERNRSGASLPTGASVVGGVY
jgi:hypothetical protein